MISVKEAKQLVLQNTSLLGQEEIAIAAALNRIAAQDIISPLHLPPFHQSAMDGYALCWSPQLTELEVIGEAPAGSHFGNKLTNGYAVKIFTGAPIPEGADTVIMKEKVAVNGSRITLQDTGLVKGSNVRIAGSQVRTGETAIEKGQLITPAGVGYIASLGITSVKVYKLPKVALIVTGSELKQPGEELGAAGIYESNSSMLVAALASMNLNPVAVHIIKDDPALISKALHECLPVSDVVLVSGGISAGDYDFSGSVFREAGIENIFYKIRQKPGKPLFFGKHQSTLVYGLPGNPAAALSCFYEYVYPALRAMQGYVNCSLRMAMLPLESEFRKKKGLSLFLKGKTMNGRVKILDQQESFILSSFAQADCLVYLPEDEELVPAGSKAEVHFLPTL